ncbi:hypothetical protein [Microbacterium sp. ZW T5_56]
MTAFALIVMLAVASLYWAFTLAGLAGVGTLLIVTLIGWIVLRTRPRPKS